MSSLKLLLLGPPRLEQNGQPLQISRRKAMALLTYLAVTGEPHTRDGLATMFWPEADQSRARAALRRVLSDLNKVLGNDWLMSEGEVVALNEAVGLDLDVHHFQRLLPPSPSQGETAAEIASLVAAVALYRDDFLAGFTLPDSPAFDDWQFFQTETLRDTLATALEKLVAGSRAQTEYETAISYARRWLALDLLREAPHRALMELFTLAGQRAAALRQYQRCVRTLAEELGVAPAEATTALYERIRRNEIKPPDPEPDNRLAEQTDQPQTEPLLAPIAPDLATPPDEVRPVTVLFAGLGHPLDDLAELAPEDMVEATNTLLQLVTEAVEAYGTPIDRFAGDGVQAVFGMPQLHEDDAERAVRAALEIQAAAEGRGVEVAIGLSTGSVYFGPLGTDNFQRVVALGPVVNLAVRLQDKAPPGQILVSQATYRQTRRAFEFISTPVQVREKHPPLLAYRPLRVLPYPEKVRGLEGVQGKLIGRVEELNALKQALVQTQQGSGQIVSIIGEAGLGKTRLISEVRPSLENELSLEAERPISEAMTPKPGVLWLEGRCLEFRKATSYWPFIDLLETYLCLRSTRDQERVEGLTAHLAKMVRRGDLSPLRREEIAVMLGNLLSIRFDNAWDTRLKHASREQIRHQTFTALYDFIVALAKQQPLALIFEDLHWADDLSLDLLSLLLEAVPTQPLLLLLVYRPEPHHKLERLGRLATQKYAHYYRELRLRELPDLTSRQLLDSLLVVDNLPPTLKARILERSRGNPFFVEETIRSLIEAGAIQQVAGRWQVQAEIEGLAVPESVQSVILSRVDRLPPELKQLLQYAAVLGRLFRLEIIARVMPPTLDLEQALWTLEETTLIYPERVLPQTEYSFKHVLTQEAIYQTLSPRRRQALHRQIAEAIETLYTDNLREYYEQLAHHFYNSMVHSKAVEYLIKAGQKSYQAYYNDEAIHYLNKAWHRLDDLPPETVSAATVSAWRLAALTMLGEIYYGIGQNNQAEAYFRQAIAMGESRGEAAGMLIRLYHWLGEVLHWLGRHEEAVQLGQAGLSLLGSAEARSVEAVLMNQMIAIGYANLNNQTQFRQLTRQTASFIQDLPYSEELRSAYLHIITGLCDRQPDQALRWIERLERLAGEHYDLRAMAEAHEHRWGVNFDQGDLAKTLLNFSHIIDLYTRIGEKTRLWRFLGSLTWSYIMLGQINEAERFVSQELAVAHSLNDAAFLAESHFNLGVVQMGRHDWVAAGAAFESASQQAIESEEVWLQWLAAYGLGQVYLQQGDKPAALTQFQTALATMDAQTGVGWRFRWWPFFVNIVAGLGAAAARREGAPPRAETLEYFRASLSELGPDKIDAIKPAAFKQGWLEPTAPPALPSPDFSDMFSQTLDPAWTWHDPFSDCHLTVTGGLEIRAAKGRDLWYANHSAPRLLRPVSGDFVAETHLEARPGDPATGQGPALGGLLLWHDSQNFLRLVWGNRGVQTLSFEGCLDDQDVMVSCGHLSLIAASPPSIFLRLRRHGTQVQALCSPDAQQWFSLGQIEFAGVDPVAIGLHAVGWIDPLLYPGAYPTGTTTKFTSFQLWQPR